MTGSGRKRYEIHVRTRVAPAALARLRTALTPTAVPRSTVYRLRVPADRDFTEVVAKLTERDVELLQVRRCPEPPAAVRERPDREGVLPFHPAPLVAGPAGGPEPEAGPAAAVVSLDARRR
jgi:hypothetical protein